MLTSREHSINSLQSYMYAFQIAGCRALIGWVQAAGQQAPEEATLSQASARSGGGIESRSVASLSCCLDPSRDVQSVSWYSRLWDGKTAGDCCLGFLW
jgi:hypothetical protein